LGGAQVTRPDLEKLLGGYAAGTLTPEERRALFEAALTDQALFDALADEEVLREVLADPASRERVLLALVEQPPSVFEAFDVWLRRHPVWALAATAAAAVVLIMVVARTGTVRPHAPDGNRIAMARKPAPPSFTLPTPSAVLPRQHAAATRAPAIVAQGAPRAVASAPALAKERERVLPAAPPPRLEPASPALNAPTTAAKLRDFETASAPPPPPPPPPRASSDAVSVQVAAEAVQVEAAPARQLDRNAVSSMPMAGRDAGALVKLDRAAPGAKKPFAKGKAEGGAVFGLSYALLRRGEANEYVEIPPDTPLAPGESARLRIDAYQNGYVYLFAGKQALFTGPALAGQAIFVDVTPGTLHLVLLPEPDTGPLSTLVSRIRRQLAGKGLGVEAPGDRPAGGQSVSVVSPNPAPAAAVLADISVASR
jgi:hypothetical protein